MFKINTSYGGVINRLAYNTLESSAMIHRTFVNVTEASWYDRSSHSSSFCWWSPYLQFFIELGISFGLLSWLEWGEVAGNSTSSLLPQWLLLLRSGNYSSLYRWGLHLSISIIYLSTYIYMFIYTHIYNLPNLCL